MWEPQPVMGRAASGRPWPLLTTWARGIEDRLCRHTQRPPSRCRGGLVRRTCKLCIQAIEVSGRCAVAAGAQWCTTCCGPHSAAKWRGSGATWPRHMRRQRRLSHSQPPNFCHAQQSNSLYLCCQVFKLRSIDMEGQDGDDCRSVAGLVVRLHQGARLKYLGGVQDTPVNCGTYGWIGGGWVCACALPPADDPGLAVSC